MTKEIRRKKETNSLTIISLFLLIVLLVLCSSLTFNYPTIKISAAQNGIVILIIVILNSILNRDSNLKSYYLYADSITILLFFRTGYYLWVTLSSGKYEHLANLLAVFLSFFAYLWSTNVKISATIIARWCELLLVIIGIQTIVAVIDGLRQGFPFYMLKSQIVTPIGASNSIATFLVILIPYIYKLEPSKFIKNFSLISTIGLIFLTRSNSGILTICILIFIILLFEKKYKLLKTVLLIISFFAIIYLINKYSSDYLLRMVDTFQMIFSKETRNYNVALNGRLQIFSKVILLFLRAPLFGYGFSYRIYTNDLMAHNWILESLVTGGLISLISEIMIFMSILYKISVSKSMNKAYKEAMILVLFATLFQGMAEPSLGTINFDLIFWLLIGHGMYVCNQCERVLENNIYVKR